ncbi:MAG: hypothetical protein ACREAU_00115 [Nitrosopumilaceae archaeon]
MGVKTRDKIMVRINKNELIAYLKKKISIMKPGSKTPAQVVDFGLHARRTSQNLQRCGC